MKNKQEVIRLIDHNTNEIHQLIQKKVDIWTSYVVLSNLWWLGVILTVLPWTLWGFKRRKASSDRILYGGLFVMVISVCLDVLDDQFGLWHYHFNVIPVLPTYFPWDITLMPVSVMFLLQYKPHANPFLKAGIFAVLTSYAGEPIFSWLEIYVLDHWEYLYSVPIQFLIFLAAHYLTRRTGFSQIQ